MEGFARFGRSYLVRNALDNSVTLVDTEKFFDDHTCKNLLQNLRRACKGRKFCIFVHLQKGVPVKKAEIIPIEPDAGSAVEGILSSF